MIEDYEDVDIDIKIFTVGNYKDPKSPVYNAWPGDCAEPGPVRVAALQQGRPRRDQKPQHGAGLPAGGHQQQRPRHQNCQSVCSLHEDTA